MASQPSDFVYNITANTVNKAAAYMQWYAKHCRQFPLSLAASKDNNGIFNPYLVATNVAMPVSLRDIKLSQTKKQP